MALFVRPFGLPRPRGQTCLVSVARFVHRAGEELEADDGVDYHDERHQQHDLGEGDHGQHDGVNDDLQACISRQAGFPERVGVNSTVIISIAIWSFYPCFSTWNIPSRARTAVEPGRCCMFFRESALRTPIKTVQA